MAWLVSVFKMSTWILCELTSSCPSNHLNKHPGFWVLLPLLFLSSFYMHIGHHHTQSACDPTGSFCKTQCCSLMSMHIFIWFDLLQDISTIWTKIQSCSIWSIYQLYWPELLQDLSTIYSTLAKAPEELRRQNNIYLFFWNWSETLCLWCNGKIYISTATHHVLWFIAPSLLRTDK